MGLLLSLPRSPLPSRVREGPKVYRPRHPERTALYRLFEGHFEEYLRAHEERFEERDGPLRGVVKESVEAYLECGRLHGGFARLHCPKCRCEHLLAFSCRTRNFCPSCQAKRAALLSEHLEEVLAPVAHRHFVFTIPKALRALFARERSLLALLPRCAFAALRRHLRERAGRKDASPGFVASIQTFGSALPFHPHVHALATDGLLARDGTFVPVEPDARAVEELFRRLLIAALVKAERLSEEFAERLLAGDHSGFSVYAEQTVLPHERDRLARLARYMARAPLPSARLREGPDGRLLVRTGSGEVAFSPVELIHALAQQIPDKGQHLVRYYGAYANRSRKLYRAEEEGGGRGGREDPRDVDSEFASERRRSWARLMRKILEVDPLHCPKCGSEMRIVAVITDPAVVDRILDHLDATGGHDPFDARAPPDG